MKASAFDPAVTDEWASAGACDAHCHLDRSYTWDERYYDHEGGRGQFIDAPLWMKQDAVGTIHRGEAFTEASLRQRMTYVVEKKIAAGEKRLDAIADCSPDIGDRSFRIALALKETYAKQIDIKVGAYPIFGFKTFTGPEKNRLELIEALAPEADFLIGLPERDARPDHAEVGFGKHVSILAELAVRHGIPLRMHLDQTGRPGEDGTERFIEAIKWLVTDRWPLVKRPGISAVHVISPSSYDETRFLRLVHGLKEHRIGVDVCPHAALSMRPMRNDAAPIHNLVARVMELVLAGIRVRLGTDNIRDLFMPRPASPLLSRELDALASALRFYDDNVIYKLVRGEAMNNSDLASVARSLDGNYAAYGWAAGSEQLRG